MMDLVGAQRGGSVFYGDPLKIAAPDPVSSPELLDFVAHRYDLAVGTAVDLGGSFNLNLLIDHHVLRVYGPWVSSDRLADCQRVRAVVSGRGTPVPGLVPALDGSTWYQFGDCVLEVEQYVPGSPMASSEQLRLGMIALGKLHTQMADLTVVSPPPLANHLPQERALDATAAATAYIRDREPSSEDERYCQIAEQLADLLPEYDLPTQLVHGDYWDNNVLFRDEQMVAVLDFDFAGVRPRVDDLALPLGYLLQSGYPVAEVQQLVDAYDSGTGRALTEDERAALPYAMARGALFFLQYLLLPAGDEHARRQRQEFRDRRGPACAWWLRTLSSGAISPNTFR